MTESEYIDATNLTRVRDAMKVILGLDLEGEQYTKSSAAYARLCEIEEYLSSRIKIKEIDSDHN